ncbi:MAG TPA: PIN domain-containing protein [Thermoanaerobaculia bacterium]|nr:PIN domain-containing protein [Thermoanaerobaculia bacterium]
MSASYVLATSALQAFENNEPGADRVAAELGRGAVISAYDWYEVLAEWGQQPPEALLVLAACALYIVPFDEQDALEAARLCASTGLSLGVCACLVTASSLGLPVLTADKAMAALDVGVIIVLIR